MTALTTSVLMSVIFMAVRPFLVAEKSEPRGGTALRKTPFDSRRPFASAAAASIMREVSRAGADIAGADYMTRVARRRGEVRFCDSSGNQRLDKQRSQATRPTCAPRSVLKWAGFAPKGPGRELCRSQSPFDPRASPTESGARG